MCVKNLIGMGVIKPAKLNKGDKVAVIMLVGKPQDEKFYEEYKVV